MVDNRGISPLGATYFKADNATANKMSDEKQGQGGEYFAQDLQEEEYEQENKQNYQDRSAQLRASLNGLAMANAGSIMLMKTLKSKQNSKDSNSLKENKDKDRVTAIFEENSQEEEN